MIKSYYILISPNTLPHFELFINLLNPFGLLALVLFQYSIIPQYRSNKSKISNRN